MVGIGLVTVNPFVFVAEWPSVFVTTTFHSPTVFPLISNVPFMFVEVIVSPVPVIGVCPVLVRFTLAPALKFIPVRLVKATDPVFTPELGVILEMVGAGYPTT